MRDPAREPPDGLHLLRMQELLLEHLSVGQVCPRKRNTKILGFILCRTCLARGKHRNDIRVIELPRYLRFTYKTSDGSGLPNVGAGDDTAAERAAPDGRAPQSATSPYGG